MGKGNPHRSGRIKGGGGRNHGGASSANEEGYKGRRGAGGVAKGERPATRSSRIRLVDDPDQREKQLNAQLKAMSLYASQTSGDGNCLFRALSDQLYGHPNLHAQLRFEICDYLEASPDRFAGFVDIEKPFDEYVKTMRQNGTYGGHLELSAFSSLKKKEIKIVQPGLVYVVTGDDDSSEAVAERQAIEERRQRIQARLPPGSEGPPPTARQLRRQQREVSRSRSKALDETSDTGRIGEASGSASGSGSSSRATAEPSETTSTARLTAQQNREADADDDEDLLLNGNQLFEAAGPLYIAYHNWEHYSSVRNVAGPHTGLPRIDERNVLLAAQQASAAAAAAAAADVKGKSRHRSDGVKGDEEYENPKPTECEELILRSAPGHSLFEVRSLLKQHGNLWETVVEVLIARDTAEEAQRGGSGDGLGRGMASSPPGRTTRSRGASQTYLNYDSPIHRPTTVDINPSAVSALPLSIGGGLTNAHQPPSLPLKAVPEHVKQEAWRSGSPATTTGSSNGDGTSASSAQTPLNQNDELGSVATTVSSSSGSLLDPSSAGYAGSNSASGSGSTPPTPLHAQGTKRPASSDLMDVEFANGVNPSALHGSRSPKRRSSSREREREERSVDGALASEFDAATNTALKEVRKDYHQQDQQQQHGKGGVNGIGMDGPTSSARRRSSSSITAIDHSPTYDGDSTTFDADDSASSFLSSLHSSSHPHPSKTYTYSLHTSRKDGRLLSPPLSPSLIATAIKEGKVLSGREKREVELKRKRDRQRERRALARRGKEGKSSTSASASAPGAATMTADKGSSKKQTTSVSSSKSRPSQQQQQQLQQRQSTSNSSRRGGGAGGAGTSSSATGLSSSSKNASSSREEQEMPRGFVELKI